MVFQISVFQNCFPIVRCRNKKIKGETYIYTSRKFQSGFQRVPGTVHGEQFPVLSKASHDSNASRSA